MEPLEEQLSSVSLQSAFEDFVKKKKKRAGNKGKPPQARPALTEQQRAQLRALFVETARKYIGVPYARKHHAPQACTCDGCSSSGRQLYHEPLFLDCCGLVRRVARDLGPQLGFRLGRWNQAYQYDTLPVRLREDELQPGDLIFYSGIYNEPKSRRHPFDMTHVEIFIGGATGEATIGSRERYKFVAEYPSFKFASQRWRLIAHHFCSLDTWLDGVCQPQTPTLWRPRRRASGQQQQQARAATPTAPLRPQLAWNSGKFSIFGSADQGQDDGQ